MTVSFDVGADNLPGQGYNFGRIVMRSDNVRVVDRTLERPVARSASGGYFNVDAPGQRYKVFCPGHALFYSGKITLRIDLAVVLLRKGAAAQGRCGGGRAALSAGHGSFGPLQSGVGGSEAGGGLPEQWRSSNRCCVSGLVSLRPCYQLGVWLLEMDEAVNAEEALTKAVGLRPGESAMPK